jgi:hypothetical protein
MKVIWLLPFLSLVSAAGELKLRCQSSTTNRRTIETIRSDGNLVNDPSSTDSSGELMIYDKVVPFGGYRNGDDIWMYCKGLDYECVGHGDWGRGNSLRLKGTIGNMSDLCTFDWRYVASVSTGQPTPMRTQNPTPVAVSTPGPTQKSIPVTVSTPGPTQQSTTVCDICVYEGACSKCEGFCEAMPLFPACGPCYEAVFGDDSSCDSYCVTNKCWK